MGYKENQFRKAQRVWKGFIWTIWDIKQLIASGNYIQTQFYLNHMGYKVWNEGVGYSGFFGFIWTIWDIKYIWELITVLTISGFIWTIWDIKFGEFVTIETIAKRFIWTIWDIKQKFFYITYITFLVLSEPYGI